MLNRLLILALILFFIVGGYVAYTAVTLPNVRTALATGVEPTQTSQILARDNSVIMAYGKYQHKALPLAEMPQSLIDALIATEDRRFYQHKGIDPIGTARAIVEDVRSHGVREGGSTLTQQLARNIFLSNERSMQRKVKEALLAIKLEQQLTKDQILELYLNNVYFGEGAYGIGAASNIYFGKPAHSLTEAESALLAGLPQAPSLYNPFSNPDLAIKRRNEVLHKLVEVGKLTEEQGETLSHAPLHLNARGRALSSADKTPFFNHYVIQQVLTMLDMDEQTFWQQGLKIQTTLDPRAQDIAVNEVRAISNAYGRTGRRQQAALLSLNDSGGIIAYVGGKDYGVSQFDRVSQAHRLAGSLFKAFVYTTAIQNGISPVAVYQDAPVSFGSWHPENYDKHHHGYMSLAQAIAQSNNTIAVKVAHDVTPEAVIQTAQKMGIQSPIEPNLSIALGAVDVTLKEMTTAYSVFNNNGDYVEPYTIQKIVDRNGNVLYEHRANRRQVLQRSVRDTMVELMEGVVRFGTGKAAQVGDRDIAGKTGTTDAYRDAWFIGYTPGITTGVWVGNDDNTEMHGITGGTIPAKIWHAFMSQFLASVPKEQFDLSQAIPVQKKDFFVYNLANLTSSEGKATNASNGDVPAEASNNPEGGEAAATNVPAANNDDQARETPPPMPILEDVPESARPNEPAASNSDRFFDFNAPRNKRFDPSSNNGDNGYARQPAPRNDNSRAPVPQPIIDPVTGETRQRVRPNDSDNGQ